MVKIKPTLRAWAGIVIMILLMAAAFMTLGCEGDKQSGYVEPPPPQVVVQKPVVKPVTVYAEYPGMTQAYASVNIRARVEGFLLEMYFQPSTMVKKNQELFKIDPKTYQADLDKALAQLATQKAELQLAEATYTRKARAYKERAVSEVDVIEAKAQVAEAKAGIQSAEAEVESARINLGYTNIYTPIEGRVSRQLVDVGNLVGAGETTLLTTVVDDDPLYAYFNVPESDLLRAMRNSEKRWDKHADEKRTPKVYMGPGEGDGFPHEGKLDYLDNKVDPGTGTIQIRGIFPNSAGKLLAGMFVRVRVPVENIEKAVLVPEAALGSDQGGRFLLVVNDKDMVEHRIVEVGSQEEDMRVIRKGLKAEERVITQGVQWVRPGIKVTPVTAEQAKEAEAKQAKEAEAKQEKQSQGGEAKSEKTGGDKSAESESAKPDKPADTKKSAD